MSVLDQHRIPQLTGISGVEVAPQVSEVYGRYPHAVEL